MQQLALRQLMCHAAAQMYSLTVLSVCLAAVECAAQS
jgi:hypothetical protein